LKPWTSGKGFLIVVAGIPVYLIWSRGARARMSAIETNEHNKRVLSGGISRETPPSFCYNKLRP
jgi:hypothetical protein